MALTRDLTTGRSVLLDGEPGWVVVGLPHVGGGVLDVLVARNDGGPSVQVKLNRVGLVASGGPARQLEAKDQA